MQRFARHKGPVEKVVIPAAGLGSRMLPITKAIPKEMLPVGRKPMIQHAVEEAVASGIKQICIVLREGKEIIRDYFRLKYDARGRDGSLEELESLVSGCEISFVSQEQPLGLGDALLRAKDFVGSDSFVMIVPDQLMRARVPATLQLLGRWQPGAHIWSSMIRIPKEEVPFFVGARGFEYQAGAGAGEYKISRILTEEETRRRHRDLDHEVRGFGRTIYPPEIFDYLTRDFINPQTGEVDLLKTFEACARTLGHRGVLLEGWPLDLGTFQSYYHYLPKFWERGS